MKRLDYSTFLKKLYGCRVQKLNVNAGFTCPNRDGTLARGGCIYCNNTSFTPSFSKASTTVTRQLEEGKKFYSRKYSDMRYLAYFQSFTSTYAPPQELEALYIEALAVPEVIGLVISTRPDCLSDEIIDLIANINRHHPVIVEIGIESSHDSTLQLINRCHTWQCAAKAVEKVAARGITTGAHLILGLPSETRTQMLDTVKRVAKLPLNTIKFHQLQVIKGTQLAKQWKAGEVEIMQWSALEYAAFCKEIITLLPPHIVIERMVSTAPPQMLLHPRWGLKQQEFRHIFSDIQ